MSAYGGHFRPEAGLIVQASRIDKMVVLLKVAALCDDMVPTVVYYLIGAVVC